MLYMIQRYTRRIEWMVWRNIKYAESSYAPRFITRSHILLLLIQALGLMYDVKQFSFLQFRSFSSFNFSHFLLKNFFANKKEEIEIYNRRS